MFKIVPVLYKARRDAEVAEVQLAQLEFNNTERLFRTKVVSQKEVALLEAKLAKAQAKAELAKAELNFTNGHSTFDGIVDRLNEQEGSLIKEGDILTTLSDNSVMWVYFNVPEARYLEYMAEPWIRATEDEQDRTHACERQQVPAESARSARSRPNSTTKPGTSPSARIFRTRTACCVTVRPAPC